jgi:hypothetical protein
MAACHKSDDENLPIGTNNLLIGVWPNKQLSNLLYTMTKSYSFVDTLNGMEFKADGTFIKRANSGWCGIPPILYTIFSG